MNDKEYKNYLKEKWKFINIKLKNNDENSYKESQTKFLDDLNNEYNIFIEFANKNTLDLKKSPLTIFDAPWGTGKTYFFENLIQHEGKFGEFDNIILIDVWKFSYRDNIPIGVLEELLNKLTTENDKVKDQINNLFKNLYNIILKPLTNNLLKIDLPSIKMSKNNKNEKYQVKFQTVEISKTIIVLDNIERIGEHSWDILKAIFLLQQNLKNAFFVLPMNKEQSIYWQSNNNNNNEYQIEKFVDTKYFKFTQDYLGIIKNSLNDENYKFKDINNVLEEILNFQIEGQLLSIREVEKDIKSTKNKIFEANNRYKILKIFWSEIWGAFTPIEKYILKDLTKYKDINKKVMLIHMTMIKNNFFLTELEKIDKNISNWEFKNSEFDENIKIKQQLEQNIKNIDNEIKEQEESLKKKTDINNEIVLNLKKDLTENTNLIASEEKKEPNDHNLIAKYKDAKEKIELDINKYIKSNEKEKEDLEQLKLNKNKENIQLLNLMKFIDEKEDCNNDLKEYFKNKENELKIIKDVFIDNETINDLIHKILDKC